LCPAIVVNELHHVFQNIVLDCSVQHVTYNDGNMMGKTKALLPHNNESSISHTFQPKQWLIFNNDIN